MNIAIEAQRIFRAKKHGMDIVILEALKAMQQIKMDHHIDVFVQPDEDICLKHSSNLNIQEIGSSNYAYWEQIALPKAVKKTKIDLLHTTSNTAPILSNIPLVVTIHDVIYLENLMLDKGSWYQRMGNMYRRWNVPIIAKKASKIITVSDYENERIQHFLKIPAEKIVTIYNACSEHFFEKKSESEISKFLSDKGLPERFVLYLGNTDPKKNLGNVIKAIKLIKDKGKLDFKLVMPDLGEDYLWQELKKQNATDIKSAIHLTGYIPNIDLPYLYQGALCFLYPSLRESFGIPMLEAMASSCPLICSNTSAMPEIASDAAYYVDPLKAEEIAEGILNLTSDSIDRDSLIKSGRHRAAQFAWKKTAQKMLEVYSNELN
jgi:glycosyltransferase involved in cell wall biosynthesis